MNEQEIRNIISNKVADWTGDNAMQGLQILSKYADGSVITGASHDVIYSISIDDLVDNITQEDMEALGRLNWGIDNDAMFCFV